MKDVEVDESFEQQDIKSNPISADQVEEMYEHTKSYEALINKRARKLKGELESNPIKSDDDYKALLLKEYTFLKRPVFKINDTYFIGNAKATINNLKVELNK